MTRQRFARCSASCRLDGNDDGDESDAIHGAQNQFFSLDSVTDGIGAVATISGGNKRLRGYGPGVLASIKGRNSVGQMPESAVGHMAVSAAKMQEVGDEIIHIFRRQSCG